MLDHGLLEPGVHPALGHRGCGGGDLVQQGDADGVVVHARGDHDHGDDQAKDVGGDVPLAAGALLARIPPGRVLRRVHRGPHRLRVQDDGGGILVPLEYFAGLPAQQVVDGLGGAVVAPLGGTSHFPLRAVTGEVWPR